ncbi:unnamed protein product [Kuraishia capsulata CBS 1993]|uniref:Uncharacterized protein n=1 Tax=Kuraishia capsulata CBS 1993 TaxID=1382522 RepID=W6MNW2_9ASCO|nr:uncharacterized protein KUCA_T00004298001 [Kuraishia capsulata CBS 1993]CDK28316.1 unnamed protein product [Kuraishia capsulata CBS 1993]
MERISVSGRATNEIEAIVANRRKVYDVDIEQYLEFRKELWAVSNSVKLGKAADPNRLKELALTLERLQTRLGLNVRLEKLKYSRLSSENEHMDMLIDSQLSGLVTQMDSENRRLRLTTDRLKRDYRKKLQLNRLIRNFKSAESLIKLDSAQISALFNNAEIEDVVKHSSQVDGRQGQKTYTFRKQNLSASCRELEKAIESKKAECAALRISINSNREKWLKISQRIKFVAESLSGVDGDDMEVES